MNLFDRIDTTATTWLGLTMACAQCHDHKYDPMTQRDYYSLLDAFNRVPESGTPPASRRGFASRHRSSSCPTERTRRRIAALEARSNRPSSRKARGRVGLRGLAAGVSPTASPPTARACRHADFLASRNDPQRRREEELDAGLRKHFDDKVRPTLAARLPALSH